MDFRNYVQVFKLALGLTKADDNRVEKALKKFNIHNHAEVWDMEGFGAAIGYKVTTIPAVSNKQVLKSGAISFFCGSKFITEPHSGPMLPSADKWDLYGLVCHDKYYLVGNHGDENKTGSLPFENKQACVRYFQRHYDDPDLYWFPIAWRFEKDQSVDSSMKIVARVNRNYLTSGAQSSFKKMIKTVPKDHKKYLLIK